VTGWLAGALSRMLAGAARLLAADRRHWADAVRAEAGQVPAGWPRLGWLAGGLWLVAKERGMARKIGYAIGAVGIATAAAWVVWLSWRTSPLADPESATDRVRVLVGLVTLAGLPWVARGRGLFGPVADSSVARFARIGGCAAICSMGLAIVHVDSHAGINGVVGSGQFSWLREIVGLAVLIAAIAAPPVLRARRPRTAPEESWVIVAIAAIAALLIVPIQAFAVGTAAVILAATSRRSPVTTATWTTGLIASLPIALAACVLPFSMGNLYNAMFVVALVAAAAGTCAGMAASRLVTGAGSPDELRARRISQGALAGAIAGATGGLAATAFSPILGEMLIAGLLAGAAGGSAGASIVAHRRARSITAAPVASDAL
jgi:hypothetical protein